jgi:hypothetical protein
MNLATASVLDIYSQQNHYLFWGNSDEFLGSLATASLDRTFG